MGMYRLVPLTPTPLPRRGEGLCATLECGIPFSPMWEKGQGDEGNRDFA